MFLGFHWHMQVTMFIYILLAASRLALAECGMYKGASRPKMNRAVAGGHVHKRFAPERKPACGRWACTRALRTRKETDLRPVGMYYAPGRKRYI